MDSMPCSLVIPAAGDSARFADRTPLPKGLIRFKWRGSEKKTMIQHIVPNDWPGAVLVGCKQADYNLFRGRLPPRIFVRGIEPTSGQAESVLSIVNAEEKLLGAAPIVVVNSDNAFSTGVLNDFRWHCQDRDAAIGAVTFKPTELLKRYGYVDQHPRFTRGAEKTPISAWALAGAFYFRNAALIRKHAIGNARYLSEWFAAFPKPKLSFEIPIWNLYEWGTAQLLEYDVPAIDWNSV